MKSLMKTISFVLAALLLVFGVIATGTRYASAEETDGVAVGAEQVEPDDFDEPSQDDGEQQSSGITYTTPADAFREFGEKFVGFFKTIGDLLNRIKEKAGVGAYIGVIAGAVVIYLFFLFCLAIAFKKAGVNPVLAFIPFVAVYYCFKIGWETEKLWTLLLALAAAILFGIFAKVREISGWEVPSLLTTLVTLVSLIGWAVVIVFTIHLSQGWAEGFKLHFAFGIGLLILPIVFVPILALIKNVKYQYALGTGQVKVD